MGSINHVAPHLPSLRSRTHAATKAEQFDWGLNPPWDVRVHRPPPSGAPTPQEGLAALIHTLGSLESINPVGKSSGWLGIARDLLG